MTIKELLAFLRSKGYDIKTGRGRHGTKAVKGNHKIPIPRHGSDVGKGVAHKILTDAGFTEYDVMEWRR
jgi:predicted RNA binding protein YcfA (HicA-like mRNA interferase family)